MYSGVVFANLFAILFTLLPVRRSCNTVVTSVSLFPFHPICFRSFPLRTVSNLLSYPPSSRFSFFFFLFSRVLPVVSEIPILLFVHRRFPVCRLCPFNFQLSPIRRFPNYRVCSPSLSHSKRNWCPRRCSTTVALSPFLSLRCFLFSSTSEYILLLVISLVLTCSFVLLFLRPSPTYTSLYPTTLHGCCPSLSPSIDSHQLFRAIPSLTLQDSLYPSFVHIPTL